MPLLYQKAIFTVIVFMLCFTAAVMQEQQEMPVKFPVLAIPNTIGQCQSDDYRQIVRNFLLNISRQIICPIFSGYLLPVCGPGNWRRVFHLNAGISGQSCPDQWNLIISPVRSCTGADVSCRSAFSNGINTAYSKVCGRIIGEGAGSPDAFHRFISNQNTIEGNYLEGVSIIHGAAGSRTHIWTLGAGHQGHCPCDNRDRAVAPLPPAEVSNNYFCDRPRDQLWTGESCKNEKPCCSFHNPPYFSVQLPSATTDRIELRICTDQVQTDERMMVLFAEVYVQ